MTHADLRLRRRPPTFGFAARQAQEEGSYEYVSNHHGESGAQETHIKPAVLYQPLVSEPAERDEGSSESAMARGSTVPLCEADVQGPCARSARGGEGTCKSCRRRGHNSGGGGNGVMRDTSAGVGGGAHAYGRRVRANVRIRTKSGSWKKVLDTYCGIVAGAALTPGVDVFGLPAEVGCAGYGVYRAVETIVEEL